jgi:predicted HTH transcriptional regulator
MKRHELRDIISHGESSTVEFKRKFTTIDKIAREIIAFANTTGGMLIIGVDDNRKIVGVDSEKEQIAQVEACSHVITPELALTIEVVEIEFRDVVVIHVPNSQNKPHRLVSDDPLERPHERKAYIRQGENSVGKPRDDAHLG